MREQCAKYLKKKSTMCRDVRINRRYVRADPCSEPLGYKKSKNESRILVLFIVKCGG